MGLYLGTSHKKSLLNGLTQVGDGELFELVFIQHKYFSLTCFKSSLKDNKTTLI